MPRQLAYISSFSWTNTLKTNQKFRPVLYNNLEHKNNQVLKSIRSSISSKFLFHPPQSHLRLFGRSKNIINQNQNVYGIYEDQVNLSLKELKEQVTKERNRSVIAVRVRHILVSTAELCNDLYEKLSSGFVKTIATTTTTEESIKEDSTKKLDFATLANSLSECAFTKEAGGDIGWVSPNDRFLNDILDENIRQTLLSYKAGDMIVQKSNRGYHLLQVEDIMFDLNVSRRKQRPLPGSGLLLTPFTEIYNTTYINQGGDRDAADGNDKKNQDRNPALKTLTYSMESMGCQMNTADAERMKGALEALGFANILDHHHHDHHQSKSIEKDEEKKDKDDVVNLSTTEFLNVNLKQQDDKADIIVVNTCSIRDHAEQKLYSFLGNHVKRKQRGENIVIIVAGCVAQQEGITLLQRIPEIDLVMGPQYVNRLGDLLEDVFNGNQIVATEATHIMEDSTKPRRDSDICAWVNIIYGCNERCTYCVVPTTRGIEQSRPKESILREIEELGKAGYREITLLGQNIDAWGRDFTPKQKFSDLLLSMKEMKEKVGIERVRFVTSHPRYMSLNVIDAVARVPNLCEQFHVPAQSGDDEVLRNMNRGYSVQKYLEIINRIRTLLPDAAITSDFIVGFPGETEEQFENTLNLMEKVKFDMCNTAIYSPRPNTPAAKWENQIDLETKKRRLDRIHHLANQHALERSQRYIGRSVEVLVEERDKKDVHCVRGRNRQGRPVIFPGNINDLKGKLVQVLIQEATTYSLKGISEGDPH